LEKENKGQDTSKDQTQQADTDLPLPPLRRRRGPDPDSQVSKKRKLATQSRFGTTGSGAPFSSAPLDRLDARLLDPPTSTKNYDENSDNEDTAQTASHPTLSLTFTGKDIISGLRKLAELGIVNPERMPAWMTGEEGVSVVVVKKGKVVTGGG
jgi:central kinetochore subunit Mis15/CHL4